MIPLIAAMRPRQWTKNLLVFAGLIFSDKFGDATAVRHSLWIFLSFCLVSSAGYLINDILDRDADKNHPEKKSRPIASGDLSVLNAGLAAILLLAFGFAIPILLELPWGPHVLGLYAVNQALYTVVARGVAILDVFIISMGFLIRAIAGAAVISVHISPWLLLCTFLLALFLGFAKRKHEFDLGTPSRKALSGYSTKLLDQLIGIAAGATVLSYSVYAIQSETALVHRALVLTILFPMFGVFRYLQLVYQKDDGGSPDKVLLTDPWMFGTVLLWIAVSIYAMSVKGWLPQ